MIALYVHQACKIVAPSRTVDLKAGQIVAVREGVACRLISAGKATPVTESLMRDVFFAFYEALKELNVTASDLRGTAPDLCEHLFDAAKSVIRRYNAQIFSDFKKALHDFNELYRKAGYDRP